MGGKGSKATNTIEAMINVAISVINSYNQDCSTNITNAVKINIFACEGVTISNVKADQVTAINTKCLQEANTDTRLNTDVSVSMRQAAEAVAQAFSLSEATADNLIRTSVELGQKVVN